MWLQPERNHHPLPAGAVRVWERELDSPGPDGSPNVFRWFDGPSRSLDRGNDREVTVTIHGLQRSDGSTERTIGVSEPRGAQDRLTIGQARELARVLMSGPYVRYSSGRRTQPPAFTLAAGFAGPACSRWPPLRQEGRCRTQPAR